MNLTEEEIKEILEQSLNKQLIEIATDSIKQIEDIDEILERKISKLGNSGHISIPSKHIGKIARVTIKK